MTAPVGENQEESPPQSARQKKKKKKKKKKKHKKNENKISDAVDGEPSTAQSAGPQPATQALPNNEFRSILPPPPAEAYNVTNTAGGLALESLMSGRVLPFDQKAYLHGLHTRLANICPRLRAPTAQRSGQGPRMKDEDDGVETSTGILDDWDAWFNRADLPEDDAETREREMQAGMLEDEIAVTRDGQRLPAAALRSDYCPVLTAFGPGHYVGPVVGSEDNRIVEVELAFGTAYLLATLVTDEDGDVIDARADPPAEAETITAGMIENFESAFAESVERRTKETISHVSLERKLKEGKKDSEEKEEEEEHSSDDERPRERDDDDDPFAFDVSAEHVDRYETIDQGQHEAVYAGAMPQSVWSAIADDDVEGEDCD